MKKISSQPNLFVIRNGKLCQRTPKTAENPSATTRLVSQNNSALNSKSSFSTTANYYSETIAKCQKELARIKKDYQELALEYWECLNEKLGLVEEIQIRDKSQYPSRYEDKVQNCLKAIEKLKGMGLVVPSTEMKINGDGFVYSSVEELMKKRKKETRGLEYGTSIKNSCSRIIGKQSPHTTHLRSQSLISSSHQQNPQSQPHTPTSFTSTTQNCSSFVQIHQQLKTALTEQSSLLQKFTLYKTKTEQKIVQMSLNYERGLNQIQQEMEISHRKNQQMGLECDKLRKEVRRKEELIQGLMRRIKGDAVRDYGYSQLRGQAPESSYNYMKQ